MNVTARIDLLEQIGRALQARYTFNDLHGKCGDCIKRAKPIERRM